MKLKAFAIIAALAASSVAAEAQKPHTHGKGPNGGTVVDVAGHHIEFTHSASEVTIYASDEVEKAISTAGAKGRVVIQNGGKTAQAELKPAEPNKLVAKLEKPLAKGAVVVVSTTFGDGHSVQGRFTVD